MNVFFKINSLLLIIVMEFIGFSEISAYSIPSKLHRQLAMEASDECSPIRRPLKNDFNIYCYDNLDCTLKEPLDQSWHLIECGVGILPKDQIIPVIFCVI